MNLFKIQIDGYILGIGTGNGGTPIDADEYQEIVVAMQSRPEAEPGYAYRLRDDLTWELYKLPPAPPYEPTDADKAEAYDILTGVSE